MTEVNDIVYSDLQENETDDVVRFMAINFYPREPLVRIKRLKTISSIIISHYETE